MSKHLMMWANLSFMFMVVGCDDPDGAGYEDDEDEEGEVTPRCLINGYSNYSAPLSLITIPYPSSAVLNKISPTNAYGTPSCFDHYVITATNTDDPFVSFPYVYVKRVWGGAALTQSQCSTAKINYDIALIVDDTWVNFAQYYDVGHWNGTACVIGGSTTWIDDNADVEAIQVAVKATFTDANGLHFAKVGAQIGRRSSPLP